MHSRRNYLRAAGAASWALGPVSALCQNAYGIKCSELVSAEAGLLATTPL